MAIIKPLEPYMKHTIDLPGVGPFQVWNANGRICCSGNQELPQELAQYDTPEVAGAVIIGLKMAQAMIEHKFYYKQKNYNLNL